MVSRAADRQSSLRSLVRGVLVSVGAVAIAFAVRLSLQRWMGASSPFLLFTPAVMIAALSTGVGGGAFATVLSALLGSRYFLPALASEPAIERWDRISLFLLVGALITILAAVLERVRQQLADSVWREQKARADAEAANQAKDEFLALVSHELQTPASVVLGWMSTIRSQRLTGEPLKRALDVVDRNARLQSRLVADVLDTSRISSGTLRIDREPADLASIVRGTVEQMLPALRLRQLHVDADVADERWPIHADAIRLQQVLTNLISNAAKFTPPGGRIAVSMKRTSVDATIVVSDTGIGIAPEFLSRVFERFEQEPEGLRFSRNGLGLGLSISRFIVEQHGGDITVRSAGRDQGTTVTVRLPLSKPEPDHPAPRTTIAKNALRSTAVLLIDDDDDTRALLTGVLKGFGATVDACRSVAEAECSLDARSCDALLCDLYMPHTDGLTFIRRLREHSDPRRASVPAASMTASTHLEERERALAAGFQLHLEKPIAPDDLAAAVLALTRQPASTTPH